MRKKGKYTSLITTANEIIAQVGIVYILYKRGKGFMCRRKISFDNEMLIEKGLLSITGTYTVINAKPMQEDIEFEAEEQIRARNR